MSNIQPLIDVAPEATGPGHPAKFTAILLPTMARMLRGRKRILDPFAGTGRIFLLEHWLGDVEVQGIEIEPEWAALHPRTTLGNALDLPWNDAYFDAICCSPTYANRMADASVESSRGNGWQTYTYQLGRKLHPDNSGQLQWGKKYRDFHERAWLEARRVLQVGGSFVLNIKDHIRDGKRVYVTQWHYECLRSLGFRFVESKNIDTPSMTRGQNREARVGYESVFHFELARKP